jgi:hypothetical protein
MVTWHQVYLFVGLGPDQRHRTTSGKKVHHPVLPGQHDRQSPVLNLQTRLLPKFPPHGAQWRLAILDTTTYTIEETSLPLWVSFLDQGDLLGATTVQGEIVTEEKSNYIPNFRHGYLPLLEEVGMESNHQSAAHLYRRTKPQKDLGASYLSTTNTSGRAWRGQGSET